jgi:hypothetical protein
MRRALVTSDPCRITTHDHVAWSGDGPDAFDRLAVATFTAAAQRGERMLFVASDAEPERLVGLDGRDELIDRGALQVACLDETYRVPVDRESQQAAFERTLDDALADGFGGVCVVADASELVIGDDGDFAAWLEWEATADRMQATRAISGVCFFDSRVVPDDRLVDIGVLHPVLSADFAMPSFRWFADDGVARVVGELDMFSVEQLRRLLDSAPQLTDGGIDLTDTDFIDHSALLTLNEVARTRRTVQVHGAKPIVRRLWDLLDVPEPALEFC